MAKKKNLKDAMKKAAQGVMKAEHESQGGQKRIAG